MKLHKMDVYWYQTNTYTEEIYNRFSYGKEVVSEVASFNSLKPSDTNMRQ